MKPLGDSQTRAGRCPQMSLWGVVERKLQGLAPWGRLPQAGWLLLLPGPTGHFLSPAGPLGASNDFPATVTPSCCAHFQTGRSGSSASGCGPSPPGEDGVRPPHPCPGCLGPGLDSSCAAASGSTQRPLLREPSGFLSWGSTTNPYKVGGFTQPTVLAHSSGDQKSAVRVWWGPSEVLRGSLSCFFQFLVAPGVPGL